MKMRSMVMRDFTIGLVFLGGLAVFGWGTLNVVSVNLFGLTRDIEVPFAKVSGVRVGDDVRFHGFPVGLVKDVVPRFANPDNKLLVKCRINSDLAIPEDSRFVVRSAGPLGGRYVEIVSGASAKQIPVETGSFAGDAERDLFENLSKLVDEIREGNGLLHQLIHDKDIGDDFRAIVSDIRGISKSINEADGVLGALIKRQDMRDRADQLLTDVGETFKDIRDEKGALGMLIGDPNTRDKLQSFIDSVAVVAKNMQEGKGTLGRLVQEDKVYDDLEATVSGLRRFVDAANEGDGTLAMLTSDAEFRNSLKDGVTAIKDTFSRINEGEGTLGQLITNRDAYDQLMRILDNVADAVEDFREQAPISTFVNAIFTGL